MIARLTSNPVHFKSCSEEGFDADEIRNKDSHTKREKEDVTDEQ